MYLIYVDESGNTGARLDDTQQPVHFLAAVFVSEEVWIDGHEYWRDEVLRLTWERSDAAGVPRPPELHAADLYHGTRYFRGIPRSDREQIIRAALSALGRYGLDVVYAACHKQRLSWQDDAPSYVGPLRDFEQRWFHGNIDEIERLDALNQREVPGAVAWSLLLAGCDAHLSPPTRDVEARGIVIADRTRLQGFARRSVRATADILRDLYEAESSDQNVTIPLFFTLLDTVHFVDSIESPYIQLADLVAYFIMRAWRAGDWCAPGHEPHYDQFVRPAIRRAYHHRVQQNDG